MKFKLNSIFYAILISALFSVSLGFSQDKSFVIQNSHLKLEFNHGGNSFSIYDKVNNRIWESLPMVNISVNEIKNLSSEKIKLNLFDSDAKLNFWATVEISSNNRILFELDIPDNPHDKSKKSKDATLLSLDTNPDDIKVSSVTFPPAIRTNYQQGEIVFSIRSCGTIIKQSDTAFPIKNIMIYNNLGHDMPWVGVFDSKKGDGLMVLADTPFDASIDLRSDGNSQWPQILWHPSLQKWSYPRKVSYIFSQSGGYVGLAKLYRSQLEKDGTINTFAQKEKERPDIKRLKGAVLVWGSNGLRFAKEARTAGIKRAIIYGRFTASDIQTINELGFLTSEYENIMDCKEGPTGFMRDNKEKTVIMDSNGNPLQGWNDQYFIRSSVMSLAAVKEYMPALLKQYPYIGRFIDVGPADLREDYHPEHLFGREQDSKYKRGVAEYFMKDLGLIVGGEHGKSWSADVLDYTEGATSGSFWWEDDNKPGHLIKPKDLNYMSKNFVTYGNNFRSRIPLWSLVYHDCLSTSWYWGDTNDWFYEIAPEISDQKDITDILFGTMPMCWANDKGYGWDRNRIRFLQTVRNTCNFQEKIAFEEMLSHEFLNSNRTLQRTYFKNGAMAVVNYSKEPQSYQNNREEIILAAYGFYASAPDFMQSKLIENDQVVTRIVSKDFISLETPAHQIKGNIQTKGRITVFRAGPDKWHILAETNDEESRLNLQRIAGLRKNQSKQCRLTELNAEGEVIRQISNNSAANQIVIPGSNQELRLFCVEVKSE